MIATLKDIAKVLVAKHQLKQRDAEGFVNAIVDTVLEGLQADRIVKIKGFGTFKLTAVRDRESVNVNTGERIIVTGHDKISFTPDSVMRDMVNKPFAQFDTVVIGDEVKFDDIQDEAEDAVEVAGNIVEETVEVAEEAAETAEEIVENVAEKTEEAAESAAEIVEAPMAKPAMLVEMSVPETVEETIEETEVETVPETIEETQEETPEVISEKEEITEVKEEITEEEVSEVKEENIEVEEEKKVAETGKKGPVLNEHGFIIEPEEDDDDDNGSNCKKVFIFYAIIANILVAALAFVMGYMCCSNGWLKFGPERVPEQEPEEVLLDSTELERMAKIDSIRNAAMGNEVKPDSAEKKSAAKDPASLAKLKEENNPAEAKQTPAQKPAEAKPVATQKPAEVKPAEAQKKDSKVAANVPNQSAYEKDARVRTGAYYIIGTQETVKVRAGQTLKSISKFYLGEGMECYIEVYNGGVKEVTEGQTLKIPKLQLKKKTAKQQSS
ncbi:MAG: HU family DNA-binding protein [Prevotella sp.]|nr:HU family DNA-binding protein [Prevotella sp.]